MFTRFAAGTAVSTACGQLAFVLLFGVVGATALVSGAVAIVAGTVPNFLIHRYWTWRRCGPVRLRGELAPYLAVVTVNGLVATAIVVGVDRLIGGSIDSHGMRTAIVAIVFNASFLVLFVLKFALLDRVFGRSRAELADDAVPSAPAAR